MFHNIERIRYEMKYAVTHERANQVISDLAPYLEIDPHGNDGQYAVYSVYFDTRTYKCYQEKIDGVPGRIKFRLRTYLGTEPNQWFLETKERVRHYTSKHRIKLTTDQADLLLNNYLSPAVLDHIGYATHPVAHRLAKMLPFGVLAPVVSVYYHRHAYLFKGAWDTRITLDHNLLALPSKISTNALPSIQPIHPNDHLLIEFKGNGNMPQEMLDVICKNDLVAQSFSKYCACIDLMNNKQISPY